MRYWGKNQGVSANVVAGTYVVVLGIDATPEACEGLLGFAFYRIDQTEKEEYWLKGFRTFSATYKDPPPGSLISTQEHPIQDFLWSDFTAKPDHKYVYKVVPVYGQPKSLKYGPEVEVEVETEKESSEGHHVYFNRGVIGSQAYAREFRNVSPDKLTGPEQAAAFKWLSRGLEEALIGFIGQASGPGFGLRAAVYEFSYEDVAEAFGEAQKNCNNVRIVFDARIPTAAGKKQQEAKKRVAEVKQLLRKCGLTSVSTPRTDSGNFIAHNKFIVLLEHGRATAVWTGSTNMTESGIYGQSNVGHVVRDPIVAQAFLDYWSRLQGDPEENQIRSDNEAVTPDIGNYPPGQGVTPIFSPRRSLEMLKWYAGAMHSSRDIMCFTAAFGINKVFLEVLKTKQGHLNYILMESWGVNKKSAQLTQEVVGGDVLNQVAVGAYLNKNALTEYLARRWMVERSNSLSEHVKYTHNKFMLIDPLGDDPVVVTGSANFSDASTTQNDENMLIIRGNMRVADIYLGEFMRVWRHYRFRYIVNKAAASTEDQGDYEPNYLDPTTKWLVDFYKAGSVKFRRRKAFAGAHAVTG